MTTNSDDLRQDLVAAIEAAQELPREDRHHLADVFLDRLNAEYVLLSRVAGKKSQEARPAGGARWRPYWASIALVLTVLLFVIPAAFHHFPIFLLVVVVVYLGVRRARSRRSSTIASG